MSIYVGREHSMSSLAPDLVNANPEDMSNEELLENTDLLEASNQYLAIENHVIEMFLKQMDPELITGMEHTLESPPSKPHHLTGSRMMLVPSPGSSRKGSELSTSAASHFPTSLEKGPRANLKAELEEIKLTMQEINEAHTHLESVEQAVDPLTGRIPAEKFIRHIEEWLKKADSMVEKLRLRTSTLRAMRIRVHQLLEQKEELGENLHPVDYEQLQIINKQLVGKIEEKNRHLLEMKKMAESQGKTFDKDADVVEAEAAAAEEKCQAVKYRIENYTAPDVLDYIKKTAEVSELQKAVKVWSRRKKVQQIALTACKRVLRNIKQASRGQLHKKGEAAHLVGSAEGSISEESFKIPSNILL
ncbi:hypothetical protein C0J52_19695 [Blattella germanica]|nr:hypothetical protein C0J52_19695 [Blattella germanica]